MKKSPRRFAAIKPAVPRQDITYSLVAEAGVRLKEKPEVFAKTIDCIQQWLGEKAPFPLPDPAKSLESYTAEEGGYRIECVSMRERGIWAARFSHPDIGLGDDFAAVAGRHWVTDIAVEQIGERVRFSIRVTCSTPAECDAPLGYIRPALIRWLNDGVGLAQERPLQEAPWILREPEELNELEALLVSPERRLPVFLISQPDKRNWTYTPTAPTYMLDGNWLARKTIGYAHVVKIPFDLGFEWTRKVGASWSAFDGSVRVYFPGLDFDEDQPQKHRVFFKRHIWEYKYKDLTGERAFNEHAAEIVKPYNAHQRISWQEIPFVPKARIMLADQQVEQITAATGLEEAKRRYEEQAHALRQQLQEAQEAAEQWSDEVLKEQQAREHHEEENKDLRRRIQFLTDSLAAKSGEAVDEGVALPENYDEMADWVSEHLTGRLVLHPRAVRSLKDAQYEDPRAVAQSLLLLANEYRDLRSGRIELDVFEAARDALHLDCKGAITEQNAGAYGDTYYVRYPVGTMQKQFLKWHLCKGTSHEETRCMRIYFFWDEDTEQVVVGSLPAHLDNQMT